jgi:hypothetical protein
MALKTVRDVDLGRGRFSVPASASSYYPANNQTTHIHLGVPTTAGGQIAPAESRFVAFISLKVNGATVGRLMPDASGNFHVDTVQGWQPGWKDHLRNYLGPMIQT